MSATRPGRSAVAAVCPECRGDLTFVAAWSFRALWGYTGVKTYECPAHGPVFITPAFAIGRVSGPRPETPRSGGDRDALTPARRRPTPTSHAGAVAVPEPDGQ